MVKIKKKISGDNSKENGMSCDYSNLKVHLKLDFIDNGRLVHFGFRFDERVLEKSGDKRIEKMVIFRHTILSFLTFVFH